jgi:hypothetical protein
MTQAHALQVLKTGANVFLTGEPGAGKTYVVQEYVKWLTAAGLTVAVTASTGIAATHVGGMTIHAWSGIGVRDTLTTYDLDQLASRESLVRRIKNVHVLIIDEISMLDGTVLDMVEVVLRTLRQSTEPFGGVQVVCVGDFFQLPPIARAGSVARYAFTSRAWDRLAPLVCYITEQWRQDDELLLGLLTSIRRNEVEEEHYTLLSEQTSIAYEGIEPTRLYTHNADVDAVNTAKLAELSGVVRTYTMSSMGSKPLVESLKRTCLSPEQLVLKEEAMVMCTKNNFEMGYVNGTLARVVGFSSGEGYPVIETAEGRRITIEPMAWEVIEDGKVRAAVTQVPLRLAWAITVHKSQGMSLDAAEIDLSRAFVYGQGYVALSRVRTLGGLKVLGVGPNALGVDPHVVQQDIRFHTLSAEVEAAFATLDPAELTLLETQFVTARGGTLPTVEALELGTKSRTRGLTESTYEHTRRLLLEHQTVPMIAHARGLAVSTIWSHIETLLESGSISVSDVSHLVPSDPAWPAVKQAIEAAFLEYGSDRLKVIYEALGEAHSYDNIRLARIFYISSRIKEF